MIAVRCAGLILLGLLVSVSTGCATATRGRTETVRFESVPSGATVTVDPGGRTITTPASLILKRKRDYVARFELEPYAPQVIPIGRFNTNTSLGNILFGGLIGLAVDSKSGASYSFEPNPVRAVFEAAASTDEEANLAGVTFVNTSNALMYADGTGAVAITLDSKSLGTLGIDDRLRITTEPGQHTLHIEHRDIWRFADEYEIELPAGETTVDVFARPVSTQFRIREAVPEETAP